MFDLLSNLPSPGQRCEQDTWKPDVAEYLVHILRQSSKNVIDFANKYLAHRVHFAPDRKPEFTISLKQIETSVLSLWNCFNVASSIFYDGYSTPSIIHQYDVVENLSYPLVGKDIEQQFVDEFEAIKDRMEKNAMTHSKEWQQELLRRRQGLGEP
jgi:hypothetical protein